MAKLVEMTEKALSGLDSEQTYWAYNAADCTVTAEIYSELKSQLDPFTSYIYEFERACLAPALEMARRGIKVDMAERAMRMTDLQRDAAALEDILRLYGNALGYPQGINANSVPQLKELFYETLGLPKQFKYDKKVKEEKLSVDREAMEKLSPIPIANPIIKAILARRDCVKKLSVLRSGVDPDGAMRFSFNVGGTETGRWSSSRNVFGGGMNAQNITEELRKIFIAREGKKLAYVDLEQAESRAVAVLSGDRAYADACNSGDLHTTVTTYIWPDKSWRLGDLSANKTLADGKFYRQFSYRDMAKRGGHGSNYLGNSRTMAIHLKVEQRLIEDFQKNYFQAFPGIRVWHQTVATELQSTGQLTTLFGRRRHFLGRLGDSATLREAVAFGPQSLIADYMNLGVLRLWLWGKVDLLAQVHDAVLFEYPEEKEALVFEAARLLSLPIRLPTNEPFSIPCDIAVGWNWAKRSDSNPDGLTKLKPGTPDARKKQANAERTPFELLDRRFS